MEQLNSSLVSTNISSTGHPPPASSDTSRLVAAIVMSLCFLPGVLGNIIVIICRPNRQHMSSLSQGLLLNLAVSDLLSLLTLPLWIYDFLYGWIFGLVTCKLVSYVVYCSIYGSLLTVTALSVQRYLQVVHEQMCFDQMGKTRLLILLWMVALILSIPMLILRPLNKDLYNLTCDIEYSSQALKLTVLLIESLVGFVSVSVVMFAYISLQRKVNQEAFFNHPQTTRIVTSIVVTFFVLFMPHCITNVVIVAGILLKNEKLLKFGYACRSYFKAMLFVNSVLNPLLYAFALKNICTLCQKRKRRCCC